MGFFSRLLIPRSLRRARHPARALKRAATPKVIRKARRALHPVDNAVYSIERSITTSLRGRKKRKTTKEWRHGKCPVRHRSREAAARCRNP